MAYENAIRILKDSEARIAQSAEGIYDNNLVILFWENIEARRINECVKYLNDPTYSVVSGPVTFDDVDFTDDLYHLHAYYSETDQRIYRLLMRDPIDELSDSDFTTAVGTKWKLMQGETYAFGQSTVVLGIPNVSFEAALLFQEEGLLESYTDAVYLLRNVQLAGEWFHIKRESQFNASTGLYTILWTLTKFNNNEVGFIYRDDHTTVVTEVNLVEANLGVIQEFMERTRVDSNGNWYHDTGLGTHYDRLNGEDVTPDTVYPETVYDLDDKDTGRQVRVRSYYDEREKNWNIQFLIISQGSYEVFMRQDEADTAGDRFVYRQNANSLVSIERGFNVSKAVLDTLQTYVDDCPDNVVRRLTVQETGTDLFNFEITEITTDEYRTTFLVGRETVFLGINSSLRPTTQATDPAAGDPGDWSRSNDEIVNSTHVLIGAYPSQIRFTGSVSGALTLTFNGLVENRPSYINGTKIISYDPSSGWIGDDGASWNLTSGQHGFLCPVGADVFTGSETGTVAEFDYATDGTGSILASNANVLQQIDRDDQNNTWNYNIRLVEEEEEEIGEEDPSGFEGTNFIFEYGEPNNITRWIGRYTMEAITEGTLSLIGAYRDVDPSEYVVVDDSGTDTDVEPVLGQTYRKDDESPPKYYIAVTTDIGTNWPLTNTTYWHELTALKGRRLVTKFIKNERIENGKISYDVFEQIRTADINENDDWFMVGVTESLDRRIENLVTDVVSNIGASASVGPFQRILDYSTTYINDLDGYDGTDNVLSIQDLKDAGASLNNAILYARLQLASKKRRTVKRERKYFARRPVTSDLEAAIDDRDTTVVFLSDAMATVADSDTADNPPDALNASTYDVIRLSADLWCIERLTVSIDDQIYRDDDAFQHFVDSLGAYMTGLSIIPLVGTGDGTLNTENPIGTDETINPV